MVSRLRIFLAIAGIAVAAAAGARPSAPSVAPPLAPLQSSEAIGELVGDLMFHADLMHALDRMCPPAAVASSPSRDWQAVVRSLPVSARTPELRELSRKLSADAAQAMVRGSGGCLTALYARAYAQTRGEYESLLAQWAQLSV
jgi:hypothetical protein